MSLEDYIDQLMSHERQYASYFEVGIEDPVAAKQCKELGVVKTLQEELEKKTKSAYFFKLEPGSEANKAPDCIAEDAGGHLLAIEVVELVSNDAIKYNIKKRRKATEEQKRRLDRELTEREASQISNELHGYWNPSNNDFLSSIQLLIDQKSRVTLHNGPFHRYILVMHCSEFLINCEPLKYIELLTSQSFHSNVIDEVFLLFSYDPNISGHHFARLAMTKQSSKLATSLE